MTDEEREDLNTFKHDLVKQARWWQWKAETLEKENEQLKSENTALRNEADENAALSMENKMRADRLETENAALRTELEDYKIEERRAERISKYRREDARRVADKIARCCLAHCGHKVRIEAQDGFWIETCTYPPYHGKWIVEIEKCPKAEEAQKSAEAHLAELKGKKA